MKYDCHIDIVISLFLVQLRTWMCPKISEKAASHTQTRVKYV